MTSKWLLYSSLFVLIKSLSIVASSSVSVSVDGRIYNQENQTIRTTIGRTVDAQCVYDVSESQRCDQITKECLEVNLSWFLPLDVKEAEILGIRTITIERPPVNRYDGGESYSSQLTLSSVGRIHTGQYSCLIRHVNKTTGGAHIVKTNTFNLTVEGGEEGASCAFNDHCESNNCVQRRCLCNTQRPVYHQVDGQCYSKKRYGEECLFTDQCKASISGPVVCGCLKDEASGEACDRMECKCLDGYAKVAAAFGRVSCLPPVTIGGQCQSSDECKAADPKTFCSFAGICQCKSSETC